MTAVEIIVHFSASSEKGAKGLIQLIRENLPTAAVFDYIEEKAIGAEPNMGSYWSGTAVVMVENKEVNSSLIQLDSVKYGFVANAEEILNDIYADISIMVDAKEDIEAVNQLNTYLLNKVQEQDRAIQNLEAQNMRMVQLMEVFDERLSNLQEKYETSQAYIHSYVDLTNMAKVVRSLAEKVDEDILEDFPLITIQ